MKKSIVTLLCFVLALSFAAASGQQEVGKAEGAAQKAEPTTLSFYRYSNVAHNAYTLPLLELFQKENPHISIESVEVSKGGFEALANKVLLGLAAGTPPDVCEMGYTMIRTMVESGSTFPLDPFIKSDADFSKKKLNRAMMNLGVIDGKQYLMPLGVSTPAMFINKELFKKAGLDPSNPPKTWKETEQQAQVLKDAGHDGVIWSWTTTGNWIFQTMLENNGGRIANVDATEISFNKQPGVQTMEYLYDLVSKGLMPVTDQVVGTFYTGKIGMIILSSFNRVRIPKTAKFDTRMARIPLPPGNTELRLPAGGKGYMMLAKGDRQERAWEFIRFLGDEASNRIIAENSGYTPANQTLIETLTKENADDPDFILTLTQASQVVPWYSWPGENGSKIAKILRNTQESILLGKETPKEGLDRAAAEAKKLLQ